MASMRRKIKNVILNYSDAQRKVREATSNEPWAPPTELLRQIAEYSHNPSELNDMMLILWKRINDSGRNWRHVYKSLVLLEYLLLRGSDKVVRHCQENIYSIQVLRGFAWSEDGKDHGLRIRDKMKIVESLVLNPSFLKAERGKGSKDREVGQTKSSSSRQPALSKSEYAEIDLSKHWEEFIASDGTPWARFKYKDAVPTSSEEEEAQVKMALELSRSESLRSSPRTPAAATPSSRGVGTASPPGGGLGVSKSAAVVDGASYEMSASKAAAVTATAAAAATDTRKEFKDVHTKPTVFSATQSKQSQMVQPVSCLKDAYRPRISSAPTRKPSAEPDVAAGSSSAIGQYASCDQRQLAADPWSEKTHRSDSRVTFSADTTEISNYLPMNGKQASAASQPQQCLFTSEPWPLSGKGRNVQDSVDSSVVWQLSDAQFDSEWEACRRKMAATSDVVTTTDADDNDVLHAFDELLKRHDQSAVSRNPGRTRIRRPEEFLGEHSSLINFDNLVARRPGFAADNAFSQPTRLPSNPFLETCEPYTGLAQMAPSGTTATPTHATALPSLHFSPGQRMQVVAGAAGGTPSVGGATPGAPDGVASRQPTQSALKQQTNPFL